MRRRRKKIRKPFLTQKRVAIFSISLVVIIAVSVFTLGMGGLFTGYDDVDEIVEVEKETGKVNFLLVGIDKEASLTDTIMIASYDLDNAKVNMLSIPRDTRMYIGSKYQKINAAYSISKNGKKNGVNGTIEAVSRLTKIPINFYIEFNLSAFRDTIDALGGVYYDVPQDMNYDDPEQGLSIHLKKGYQLLDGDKAEQLVRFRRYPMGDIDRVKVQQNFIKALAEQKLNLSVIERIPELYSTVSKNLKTNLEVSDVARYAHNLSDLTAENINMYEVPGIANGTDYGASYWIANMTELKELVEVTFGYDAEGATIHSADGKSISKDVKVSTQTQSPSSSGTPSVSPKATETPKVTATQKATNSPEPTKTPTQNPTVAPAKTSEPTKTPATSVTPKPTEGGIKRPAAN